MAIHFTWKPDWDSVRDLLPVIGRSLPRTSPSPLGEAVAIEPATLQSRYERIGDFKDLVRNMILAASFGIRSWQKTSMGDASRGESGGEKGIGGRVGRSDPEKRTTTAVLPTAPTGGGLALRMPSPPRLCRRTRSRRSTRLGELQDAVVNPSPVQLNRSSR